MDSLWVSQGSLKYDSSGEDMVNTYEDTEDLLYLQNTNEQQLALAIDNVLDGKPVFAYKMGKIDNVPVAFGQSVTYTGLPIKVSMKATDAYADGIDNRFGDIEFRADAVFKQHAAACSASSNFPKTTRQQELETAFESKLTGYETQVYGDNPANTKTNIANNEVSFDLDYKNCKYGYAYRLTALCSLNVYACFYGYNESYNRSEYYFVATSSSLSYVLEESNENRLFATDNTPGNVSALASFDFTKLIVDGFYKKNGAARQTSVSLSSVRNLNASTVNRYIYSGYRYVDFIFQESDDNKNEVHLPDLIYTLNGVQKTEGWDINQYDEIMRDTSVRLDLLSLRDGYNISFTNYVPTEIYLVRY